MRAARLRADVVARCGAITDAERAAWLAQFDAITDSFLSGSLYLINWDTRPRHEKMSPPAVA